MKYSLLGLWLLLVILGTSLLAQQSSPSAVEYTGKLEPELVADETVLMLQLKAATEEERKKLPGTVKDEDKVFTVQMFSIGRNLPRATIMFIEPTKGDAYLYADIDYSGTFTESERFDFSTPPAKDTAPVTKKETLIKFPLSGGPFKYYPVRMVYRGAGKDETSRQVTFSMATYAQGQVSIDGRQMLVRFSVNPSTGLVTPAEGYIGMDCDGDGKIDQGRLSPESVFASSSSPSEVKVFHVNTHYVSTKSIDAVTGKIVLREHPAADYTRIELRVGATIPDFAFTDFSGKARKLSDFRGKYLMLDFWGTWCGPCVAEIPHMKAAYEKYQARGFEILGMDYEFPDKESSDPMVANQKALEKAKKFMVEKGATWTEATTESIKELTDKRFYVSSFPTTVFLDPQGKILSVGQMSGPNPLPLRGEKLLETLEKFMPTKAVER